MITKEQLHSIVLHASAEILEKYCQPLNEAMEKFEIATPKRVAAFIAQLAHESGEFTATVENLNYSAAGLTRIWPRIFPPEVAVDYEHDPERIANRAYGNRMGNGPESSGDGWRFRGRGLIGITGRDNYNLCGKGLGIDLLASPELLEGPVYATLSAAWFWSWRKLNFLADTDNFEAITKRINGGLIGYDSRKRYWEAAKQAIV